MDIQDISDSRSAIIKVIARGRSKGNWNINFNFEEKSDFLIAGLMHSA